jgi:hypothetical protein
MTLRGELGVSDHTHWNSAAAERVLAEASQLPNVRARHLRSADAYEAMAAREERTAASKKAREADFDERAKAATAAKSAPPEVPG